MELVRTRKGWRTSAITYRNVLTAGDETLPQKALDRAQR
jgi:hypothetical protein